MFVYSLDGLKIDGDAAADVEIEENETTARAAVYQVLGRLFGTPDRQTHEEAVAGSWPQRLREAAELLPYAFDFGEASLDAAVSAEDLQAEFLRLFEVGAGTEGPPAPLYGGVYAADRMKQMEEVVRFYEYFGLRTSAEDPRPPDHLATELEFMQYLTFKEAASASPRLQGSFRRAQEDFLDRQLSVWLPQLAGRLQAADPMPFWSWAVDTADRFVRADQEYAKAAVA